MSGPTLTDLATTVPWEVKGVPRVLLRGSDTRAKPGIAGAVLRLLFRCGVLTLAHHLWPGRLTVLAYHRVTDPSTPDFKGLRANVSATPEQFAAQLDLLCRWFNIISLDQLLEWLAGRARLPRYAALITFDDGYRDNFEHALPALRARCLPAVLFLATGCVGSADPFFWDLAAYCFRITHKTEADLPLLGHRIWPDRQTRERVLHAWLGEAKKLPADGIVDAVSALRLALVVDVPPDTFTAQHVTWDQVRALARSGVAIEAHTHGHAILSRASRSEARNEVLGSKRHIEAELGVPVRAFAYPNGLAGDYRRKDVAMLRQERFAAAFTLLDGPTSCRAAWQDRFEIRRILVMAGDDLASFAASVTGLTRLVRWLRRAAADVLVG